MITRTTIQTHRHDLPRTREVAFLMACMVLAFWVSFAGFAVWFSTGGGL